MNIFKKHTVTLILFISLLLVLPLIIFFSGKKQDIRPRALQGSANLLLSTSSSSIQIGEEITVLISVQLTETNLRISGADIVLLYDKNKLEVVEMIPDVTANNSNAAFTDIVHLSSGGIFDQAFNFLRMALVSRKQTSQLSGGTVSLGRVKFKAIGAGSAIIRFPLDASYTEVVGIAI